MHKPLSIEQVEYKLGLVSSLWEVILNVQAVSAPPVR